MPQATIKKKIPLVTLRKGMKITCYINKTFIKEGIIQKHRDSYFICQNVIDGSFCPERYGKKCSWIIGENMETAENTYGISNFREIKSSYIICSYCGEELNIKRLKIGYCRKCFIKNYLFTCPICKQVRKKRDKKVGLNSTIICEECYNKIPKCSLCGCKTNGRVKFSNGELACAICKRKEYLIQQGYFYTFARKKGEEKEKNFIGFELELECKRKGINFNEVTGTKGREENFGSLMLGIIEKLGLKFKLFCTNDGSLNEGIEFQSIPCTYNYLKYNFHLKKLFKHIYKYFYSHYTCGLHFHMSRETLNDVDIIKMFMFLDKNWDLLWDLSRREEEEYTKRICCSKHDIHTNYFPSDKYNALHPTKHTVEFRLFQAPNNYEEFMVGLQFTVLLRIFVQSNSKSFFYKSRFPDFIALAKKYNFHYLLNEIHERTGK